MNKVTAEACERDSAVTLFGPGDYCALTKLLYLIQVLGYYLTSLAGILGGWLLCTYPFDVFICYKETDANGRRTPDSVLATDLYHQLTQEGFKVFFSRITLEDKLGTAYEPYIFAALNSAKVMVVLGTKPEYFNAVWVKNEWSRYLALIRGGAKKVLIPAYRDMDPYDLPEEFSHLQAQDMLCAIGKLQGRRNTQHRVMGRESLD